MFAGFYFWWPKFTGKMLDERLGKIHFWTLFIGFHTTFLVQHWLGAEGMPRRYADYLAADGFTALNTVSTIGAFLLGISTLPFLYNVWKTARYGTKVEVGRPLGLRPLAGVGDLLSAAAPQLRDAAPDPLRVPGLRSAPPRGGHASSRSRSAQPKGSPGRRSAQSAVQPVPIGLMCSVSSAGSRTSKSKPISIDMDHQHIEARGARCAADSCRSSTASSTPPEGEMRSAARSMGTRSRTVACAAYARVGDALGRHTRRGPRRAGCAG